MNRVEIVLSNRLLFALFKPSILTHVSSLIRKPGQVSVLDLGCGNHSVRYFKMQFPSCYYVGIDRGVYNNDPLDFTLMNEYHQSDLESGIIQVVRDGVFDLVVLSHVLEHLRNGLKTLDAALRKAKPSGLIYVAHPYAEAVKFPSQKGTLNFFDDSTHVTLFAPGEIAKFLRSKGCEVLSHGRTRLLRNLVTMPPRTILASASGGNVGPTLWDLYGFEEFTVARVRPSSERYS